MPDISLCSEPDQVRACVRCIRNPENWPEISRQGPRQSHTRPDVRGDKCGSWKPMPEPARVPA